MRKRAEILEATLDSLPQGIAVLEERREVVFWNRAAEGITGHAAVEVLGRPSPEALRPLLQCSGSQSEGEAAACPEGTHGLMFHSTHKLGHRVPVMARAMQLRDGFGKRIGTAVLFHPAESLAALPRGETGENESVEKSQKELEQQLESLFEDSSRGGPAFGVLWMMVDQAAVLRRSHGSGACEAMLEKVKKTLSQGLRPGEHLGRWGQDEFLVISNERTPELLAAHAQVLRGLASIVDFRWWGDRVPVTVSIGTARAGQRGNPAYLLERAKAAVLASFDAGGNQITFAPEGQ